MDDFLSLTEIGKIYGVSSHVVGKWLKGLGLRAESGQPTDQARNERYIAQRPSTQPGTFFYVWSRSKTTALLDGMCYPRAVHGGIQREHRADDLER